MLGKHSPLSRGKEINVPEPDPLISGFRIRIRPVTQRYNVAKTDNTKS
jgi:hypothetical protein